MLKDPDVNKVRTKLAMIANKIHIDLADVPVFLEDYGDIYLSIAYYRNILDKVRGPLEEFSAAMDTIQRDRMLKESAEIVSTAKKIQGRANKMRDVLIDRFDMFTKSTNDMWNDMNADRFGEFKMMVEENHSTLGGLLCKLQVKMNTWNNRFPSRHTAGPNRLADFMMTDMRQGF